MGQASARRCPGSDGVSSPARQPVVLRIPVPIGLHRICLRHPLRRPDRNPAGLYRQPTGRPDRFCGRCRRSTHRRTPPPHQAIHSGQPVTQPQISPAYPLFAYHGCLNPSGYDSPWSCCQIVTGSRALENRFAAIPRPSHYCAGLALATTW